MNESPPDQPGSINGVLGTAKAKSSVPRRYLLFILIVLAVLGSVAAIMYTRNTGPANQFKTAAVKRGDLTIIVTATGTLAPVNQVEVGSELSGTIRSVEAEINDQVTKGQVLARLDTERLTARVVESNGALDAAKAKLKEAEATLIESEIKYKRLQPLSAKQLYSQQDIDTMRATYERSVAGVASAKAQVHAAEATLAANKTDLSKAMILSPIDGIVLMRNVEPGQTVASSFQTPVLFTLAEDLRQMELHVDVDEADVGQTFVGQEATFTVDAYPDRKFEARITRVNYAPKVVQDVVTYEALLSVDNSDLVLRPGMTATAEITTRKLQNVLLVPNGALRFSPPAPEKKSKTSAVRSLLPGPPHRGLEQRSSETAPSSKQQRVWLLRDKQPVAIPVIVGATDGLMTEIISGDIGPDTQVLIDVAKNNKK